MFKKTTIFGYFISSLLYIITVQVLFHLGIETNPILEPLSVLYIISILIFTFSSAILWRSSSAKKRYLSLGCLLIIFAIPLLLLEEITVSIIMIAISAILFKKYFSIKGRESSCTIEAEAKVIDIITGDAKSEETGENLMPVSYTYTNYKIKYLDNIIDFIYSNDLDGFTELNKGDRIIIKYNPINNKEFIFFKKIEEKKVEKIKEEEIKEKIKKEEEKEIKLKIKKTGKKK